MRSIASRNRAAGNAVKKGGESNIVEDRSRPEMAGGDVERRHFGATRMMSTVGRRRMTTRAIRRVNSPSSLKLITGRGGPRNRFPAQSMGLISTSTVAICLDRHRGRARASMMARFIKDAHLIVASDRASQYWLKLPRLARRPRRSLARREAAPGGIGARHHIVWRQTIPRPSSTRFSTSRETYRLAASS